MELCNHNINPKYCSTCKRIAREKRPMHEKILEVLQDFREHSTREIAEKAKLIKEDNYPDIQRSIRLLRQEGHPVDCTDAKNSIYKLLTAEEAENCGFWESYKEKATDAKEVADLKDQIKNFQDEISSLKKKITEMQQELDDYKELFDKI